METTFSSFATDMNIDGTELKFEFDLLGMQDKSKENIGLALDHIVTATNGVAAKFKRWSGGLCSLAEGFEGDVSKLVLEMIRVKDGIIAEKIEALFEALKTVVKTLDEQKVNEAIDNHAKVRRELVNVSGLGNCWFVMLYLILKQPSHDPSHTIL